MSQQVSLKHSFFGGTGIGLLFGVIMGTTTTPTVATMLGTLTAVLAGLLGLNNKHFNDAKAVRIGSFGFACVIGAYLGIYVRSHDLLSPSLESMKTEYLQLGYSEQEALQLLRIKMNMLEVPNADIEIAKDAAIAQTAGETSSEKTALLTSNPVAMQHSSLLFGANVDLAGCEELAFTDATLPLDEVINNFELTGGLWHSFSSFILKELEESHQMEALLTVKNTVCLEMNQQISNQDCRTLGEIESISDYNELFSSSHEKADGASILLAGISDTSLEAPQKFTMLLAVKDAFCE